MPKSEETSKAEAAAAAQAQKDAADKAAADKAAAKQAAVEADDGLRPRRPAKVGKVTVLSKGKTAQVITDGVHTWKEAIK